MVTKCLNPLCAASFHYLREGKLFVLDSRDRRGGRVDGRHRGPEYFWLCPSCAQSLTLNLKGDKPEAVPLPKHGPSEFTRELRPAQMDPARGPSWHH